MRAMASSAGSTPASAKKHGCMTVLMRLPIPTSRATASASITQKPMRLSIELLLHLVGQVGPTPRSAGNGLLSRNVAPGLA